MASSLSKPKTIARGGSGLMYWIRKLQSIEVGPSSAAQGIRISASGQAHLMRMLLMLLQNGLSLPRSLTALAADRSVRRYKPALMRMKSSVEAGNTLSNSMARMPRTFSKMQTQQIAIGEQSGSLEHAMERVCEQLERSVQMRKRVIKKVSYPILILVAGFGLIIFMVTYVVPEFEGIYNSSGVDLPAVTQVVTGLSRLLLQYGWLLIITALGFIASLFVIRSQPKLAYWMDSVLLHVPLLGPWLRDVAVLQFAETTLSMVECGFVPVDAVQMSVGCVQNRAVRAAVQTVSRSCSRGEKLSTELARQPRLFPSTLCQLVSIGEQSGNFPKAISGTCIHLRERLESRMDATIGLIEPVLTIMLAVLIGAVVLSIYMPMFHMFEVME
ncbi:Type II secretion system protein F [Roseimaritima multifibrata]|uniref:Type II secretion system protein F n=1 Tax=Roseimaritima multifibrata TaxID=1930274 RepID=A0A517MDV0_9BACT|nr:type II secretion system F family protein [Roseimaritima multifibrata]QDS93058.1 Type II secretion system protein F [Roseimaritima multifibrata]